jgi:hypothetical protein
MATPLSRLSINVNADRVGNEDRFFEVLTAWKPQAVLVMNRLNGSDPNNLVMRILYRMQQWGGMVIYRPYEKGVEGAIWRFREPQGHINQLLTFNTKDVWFEVGNEPRPSDPAEVRKMCKWYRDFAALAVKNDLRVVFPAFATGNFQKSEIDGGLVDDLLWAAIDHADKRIGGFSQVAIDAHGYCHAALPAHVDGQDPNKLLDSAAMQPPWKTAADIFDENTADNWLLTRELWLWERAQKLKPGVKFDMHLTEFGLDRMPNIENDFRELTAKLDSMAGKRIYGIPTLWDYWRKIFPQWSPARALCEQFHWAETIYPSHVRSLCLFTWSVGTEWTPGYNISDATEFLNLWPSYAAKVHIPPVVPPVVDPPQQPTTSAPAADSPLWYETNVHTYDDTINIRADATQNSAIVGTLRVGKTPGRTIKVIYTPYTPKDTAYMPVMFENVRGFAHEAYLVFGDPPMPTVNDVRWLDYKAFAPGVSVPVYDWSNTYARKLIPLLVGGVAVKHIPANQLTPMEAAYIGSWHIVKVGDVIGYLQPDVRMDAVKPPTPPTETVPKAEYERVVAENSALSLVVAKQTQDIIDMAQENGRLLVYANGYVEIQRAIQNLVKQEPIVLDAKEEGLLQ